LYTIRQAASMSGVPATLLRAWERRYGVVQPSRSPGGYRLYDDAAIDRLRTMRRLVDAGWSASNAAEAVRSGEVPVASAAVPDVTGAASGDGTLDGRASGALRHELVDAAIALDAARLEAALDAVFASGSFERVAEELLLPALVAVGDAWADGRLSVAGEHAASNAVLRRLGAAFQAAGRPGPVRGGVLVGMPPDGRHELGALAFAVAARRSGLPVLYLGPDLPLQDWVDTARAIRARAAVIGAVTAGDVAPAADVAIALRAALPDLAVAFGGHAASVAAARVGSKAGAIVLPDGVVAAVERLSQELARR
jgi:DNA-binding transcriptional MerR regulator